VNASGVSSGDPGGVCTCCLSSPTHWRSDSRDATGQLLTGPTLDIFLASFYLPYMGPPRVSCKDVDGEQWRSRSWRDEQVGALWLWSACL
ncbi:hypothetical protein CRENBAI_009952, partial [Crenichthys baileyi]